MSDFAARSIQRLKEKGIKPEQDWKQRKLVAVSENGKTYKAPVAEGVESAVYQIDGNLIKTGQKCDKLLIAKREESSQKGLAVFIELKGKGISHAIDQLEETINNPLFRPYSTPEDKTRARIITPSCGPASSSRIKLEAARIRFKSRYNIELKVLKNSQPDSFINP